jgi:hypothetical protein
MELYPTASGRWQRQLVMTIGLRQGRRDHLSIGSARTFQVELKGVGSGLMKRVHVSLMKIAGGLESRVIAPNLDHRAFLSDFLFLEETVVDRR